MADFQSSPPCNCCALGAGECCFATCCLPCYNGATMVRLDPANSSMLMCLLSCLCEPIGVCLVNQEVAKGHGIGQAPFMSCLCACCCPLCTVIQSREQALLTNQGQPAAGARDRAGSVHELPVRLLLPTLHGDPVEGA